MTSILFVCYGNICRSPALQAVCEHKLQECGLQQIYIDSCGISDSFRGAPTDRRMLRALVKRGISFSHTARAFEPSDYSTFDLILVVSKQLQSRLSLEAPKEYSGRIELATHFTKNGKDVEIPDPYESTVEGFENVLDLIEESVNGLVEFLKKQST